VVVVTGGGRGIGRAHALATAGRGATVVVNDLPSSADEPSAADAVVAEIRSHGGRAVADHTDVSTLETAPHLIAAAIAEFGRVDAVVANAGITGNQQPFAENPDGLLHQMIGLNVLGPWALAKAAWTHFVDQRFGRIVFTTAGAAFTGMVGNAAYAVAKAGLIGLTRALAVEGAGDGIVVNAVAPVAYTRLSAKELGADRAARLAEIAPPEAIAPLVVALVSREWTRTGHFFSAGGGHVADMFVGQTRGLATGLDWEPELILARLDELLDRAEYNEIRRPGSTSAYALAQL
jgi:NAD(P)-dependent dehydrogenase (short-subunit alcohol dehydrogenase family)